MALVEVKVPDIGDFDEVGVIEVLVKVGDTIKVEQSLITVESDKASMEIPSSTAGVVKEINGQGITVLLVEQNALMALAVAHRGYVIQTGRIVLADSAAALRQNEMVRKAYLGEE